VRAAGLVCEQVGERDDHAGGFSREIPGSSKVNREVGRRQRLEADLACAGAEAAGNDIDRSQSGHVGQRHEVDANRRVTPACEQDLEPQLPPARGDEPAHRARSEHEQPSAWLNPRRGQGPVEQVAGMAPLGKRPADVAGCGQRHICGSPERSARPVESSTNLSSDLRLADDYRIKPGRNTRQPLERRPPFEPHRSPAVARFEPVRLQPLAAGDD
jgi:hypothetical protein